MIEACLAHAVRNPTVAAYARSDLFERRRRLMDTWAAVPRRRARTGGLAAPVIVVTGVTFDSREQYMASVERSGERSSEWFPGTLLASQVPGTTLGTTVETRKIRREQRLYPASRRALVPVVPEV